jgi:hypothetical protein
MLNDSAAKVETPSTLRIWSILSFVVLVAVILFAPARIGSLGYFPPDDAGRHVGKAIADKPWNQILVMRDNITTDTHHGWDSLLGFLYKKFHIGPYGLMAFSVSFCFILFAFVPLPLLKRPESWLLVFGGLMIFEPFIYNRLFLGRPFIISCSSLSLIYLTWERLKGRKTDYGVMLVYTAMLAINSWLAPTSAYLFCIPLLGFALAREWQALIRLFITIVSGCIFGYLLTGYPLKLAHDVLFMLLAAPDQNVLSRMLVLEFLPTAGNLLVFLAVMLIIANRIVQKTWNLKAIDDPIFMNMVAGVVLGHLVGRFWYDWGMIAALIWLTREVDNILIQKLEVNSPKRFIINATLAVCFFIVLTSDVGNRWTFGIPRYPLQYSKATEEQKLWYPDSGGIFYNDDMGVFFQTFFHNPLAPWRYVLGYEPVLMKPEDLKVYRNIQRNLKSSDTYQPWIDKMRPEDRMVLLSGYEPKLERLEWKCLNRDVWVGRLRKK